MVARDVAVNLLRRTEVVARPHRITELMSLPSLEAAVDNIMAVDTNPPSAVFTGDGDGWSQGLQLQEFWLDRIAHDAARPFGEWLAFFWHGHFVSSLSKAERATLMREQIDLFRRGALGNFRDLAVAMSTQVAMLRYLDNNQNRKSSPNQNFGRELLELFLLGVGNYTERDVEASTAAWTGHTDRWETGEYRWRPEWHDSNAKQLLGRTINAGGDPSKHGAEVIATVLGNGVVPADASNVANRGRPTREVAAEFISRKLWTFLAGTAAPANVVTDLRHVAVANNFELRPWVRALLCHPDFHTPAVRQGLVRSPVAWIAAVMSATGLRAADGYPHWLMDPMGQRPLYPPNVSGWRHNAEFTTASAFAARLTAARWCSWKTMSGYWNGDGKIRMRYGTVTKQEAEATSPWAGVPAENAARRRAWCDRLLAAAGVELGPTSLAAMHAYASTAQWWELDTLVSLMLMTPEMNTA